MNISGFDMARESRDYTKNIGTEKNPNVQEVTSRGEVKAPTQGGGLTQQYHSGISRIFDNLEKAGVGSNPAEVRTVLKQWFRPENRNKYLGQGIFTDPAFYAVAEQGAGGGSTKLENSINAIADQYAALRRARDNQFNVRPGQQITTAQAVISRPSVAPRPTRVRVIRKK